MRQGTSKKCPRGANCVCVFAFTAAKKSAAFFALPTWRLKRKRERERKTALAEFQAT